MSPIEYLLTATINSVHAINWEQNWLSL